MNYGYVVPRTSVAYYAPQVRIVHRILPDYSISAPLSSFLYIRQLTPDRTYLSNVLHFFVQKRNGNRNVLMILCRCVHLRGAKPPFIGEYKTIEIGSTDSCQGDYFTARTGQ